MKRTKTPICILSAFLVISMACIGAVQVQAADSTAKQMNKKLVELARDLQDDVDLETLVENQGLKNILDQIRAAESQAEKEALAQDYVDYIQNDDNLRNAFDNLESKYDDKIETLTYLAERIIIRNNDNQADGKFFDLEVEGEELKIEKVDSNNVQGDGLILSSDMVVTTSDMDLGLLGLILIFIVLPACLAVAVVIYIIVAVIQEILLFLKTVFDNIELIIIVIGIVSAVVGFLLMVFEEVIEQITAKLLEAIQQLGKSKTVSFSERVYRFFARILALFQGLKLAYC